MPSPPTDTAKATLSSGRGDESQEQQRDDGARGGGEGEEKPARAQRERRARRESRGQRVAEEGRGRAVAPLTDSTAKNTWVMAIMPEMAKEIGSCA